MTQMTETAALAVQWLERLTAYIDSNGLRGYDPFDVKQHPLIRATQPYKWPRRATTALCDVFPLTARRLLGIERTENPKAFALVAMGSLREYVRTQQPRELERAERHLRWLLEHASESHTGLCWGYPFHVFAKGLDSPPGTPIGVVCAIAGEAFALAYDLTKSEKYSEAVRRIAAFFLVEIPRMQTPDGRYCYGYTPKDLRRVHNANLHAVEHLCRTYRLTGDASYLRAAEPALDFTLRAQREDGSWSYGEWSPDEPYEKGLMAIVDHHHTGFVLRSLHAIHAVMDDDRIKKAATRGYEFYRDRLFTDDGMPITTYATYPVDIHACAEGIMCPSVLANWFHDARDVATRCVNWTAEHMRDEKSGLPYYRRYPWFVSRLLYTRWSLAWIYRALSEYVSVAHSHAASINSPQVDR